MHFTINEKDDNWLYDRTIPRSRCQLRCKADTGAREMRGLHGYDTYAENDMQIFYAWIIFSIQTEIVYIIINILLEYTEWE